ncbi:SgcJ/EcaC family oxidoreductase [Pseudodonghicola flavimaris]|uniref:SgcJ/EcaC family oxidoreductase n=1 Tax=Pseudodonghicola flavimaris TaxID=3050036 RepID=A0ABT7F3Y1_9RHOB|nr:SgcJ/EcaC family oxidoreductase [Pseudodonghicola flavimaris]MDK3019139.1 SgcJ/EcaC family oxidoreductase [Pseudodonghicola flavimaris]
MTDLPERPGDIPAAFAAAWAARDAAALAALFAEDADFVNVVGLWWHDRAAIERAHAYGLTTFFAESQLTPEVIRTRDLGAVAVVQCRFRLTGQRDPQGRPAGPRRTILTFVARRLAAGWQVVTAQNTDVVAGAETHLMQGDLLRPADYRAPPG